VRHIAGTVAQEWQPWTLPVAGPDPLGLAQVDALAAQAALGLDGSRGLIWEGEGGDLSHRDQTLFAGDPQRFVGAAGSASVIHREPNDGLPSTTAPAGLPSSITDLLGNAP